MTYIMHDMRFRGHIDLKKQFFCTFCCLLPRKEDIFQPVHTVFDGQCAQTQLECIHHPQSLRLKGHRGESDRNRDIDDH